MAYLPVSYILSDKVGCKLGPFDVCIAIKNRFKTACSSLSRLRILKSIVWCWEILCYSVVLTIVL